MANSQDVGTIDDGVPGFYIDKFKSYLTKTGYLPVNRFYADIVMPPIVNGCKINVNGQDVTFSQAFGKDISFRAESLKAPGVAINFTNVNRYGIGSSQKFPFNAQLTDISVNFLADKQSLIWIFFYNWLNNIFNYSSDEDTPLDAFTRYRANYMVDYATDIFLHVYHYNGELSTTLQLIDAYPISMNDVALDWNMNNQLMRITVTFTFRTWKFLDVNLGDCSSRPVGVPRLKIPKYGGPLTTSLPEAPVVTVEYPDPTFNHQNKNGKFNSMTLPEVDQPGYDPISDMRLKRNLQHLETLSNGIKLYKFQYVWDDIEYVGVVAQEVMKIMPDAVYEEHGYYGVMYSKLGLRMIKYEDYVKNKSLLHTV